MPDPWPDRIIDLHPDEKLRLSSVDPDRYWAQLRAERRVEAGEGRAGRNRAQNRPTTRTGARKAPLAATAPDGGEVMTASDDLEALADVVRALFAAWPARGGMPGVRGHDPRPDGRSADTRRRPGMNAPRLVYAIGISLIPLSAVPFVLGIVLWLATGHSWWVIPGMAFAWLMMAASGALQPLYRRLVARDAARETE